MKTATPDRPPAPRVKPILGIGDIIAKALTIFFRRLPVVILLTAPSCAALVGILYLAFGVFESEIKELLGVSRRLGDTLLGFLALSFALGTGAALASGPLAGVVRAYMQGERTSIPTCFGLMFRKIVFTLPLGILLAAGVMFVMFMNALLPSGFSGFLTVLISLTGSMYLLARWAPALPTVVLERKGLDALRRSNWLSEGYRWQGTAVLVLALVIGVIFGGLFTAGMLLGGAFLINEIFETRIANSLEEFLIFLDAAIGLAITSAIMTLSVVVLRLRLIEIKEPPDIKDMITVFE